MESDSVAGAEPSAGVEDAGSSSFWKSLPGVVTACTGLVVAISGLLTGLGQAGIIGNKHDGKADAHVVIPSPVPTHDANPPSGLLPASPSPAGGELREFLVSSPGDGFSWVRKGPTKESAGVTTIASGTPVRCRDAVPDTDPTTGRRWHLCPREGGYISTRLLVPAGR